ncbi:unnamed protein product [Nippostrongylus brasiliensis]|uniref:Kelch-like protein 7 (inferred by orthology to a human protein) n=1 Tax=Nippostrongylus brasiliensis TaxID=27835 RepID=A0A0N4Y7Q6_NIPBR|nr:unnamed protein product [Nippostrongylus brasiliensis]
MQFIVLIIFFVITDVLIFVMDSRETLSSRSYMESKEIRIVVKDIDGKSLRVLVDYMYNGRLDINEKNVRVLFGAAKILQLDPVLVTFLIFIRNSWRAGPKMLRRRMGLGVTALNGIIFAVGGWADSQTIREAEMLDPRQGTYLLLGKWISLPSMMNFHFDCGVAAVNGLLYAAGGGSVSRTLDSVLFNCQRFTRFLRCDIQVEVYDPRACRWTAAQPLLKKRCGAGVTVFRDQIVVVGGLDGNEADLSSAEVIPDIQFFST